MALHSNPLIQSQLAWDAGSSLARLQERLRAQDVQLYVTLDGDAVTYLTGFRTSPHARPIALVAAQEGSTMIVPELEEEHARRLARIGDVRAYVERPGSRAPLSALALLDELLGEQAPGARVAVDAERLPLQVAERIRARGCEIVPFDDVLRELRVVKQEGELAAIRGAGELATIGAAASLAACQAGASELEVDGAGALAIQAQAEDFGPEASVALSARTCSGRERSALTHGFSSTRRLVQGDVVVHTRHAALDGYRAKLERTTVVGPLSVVQARALAALREAAAAALAAVRPGVPACAVDAAARAVIDAAGYGRFAIQRGGHGIGVSRREPPELRFDNEAPLLAGMALVIEPGFHVPGLGGFRHADTIVVTDDGYDPVTTPPESAPAPPPD